MQKLRSVSLIAFIGLFFIINANAQPYVTQQTYVTLIATNGQSVSYTVPPNTLANVVHVTPSFIEPLPSLNHGYIFYTITVSAKGTETKYYPFSDLNFSPNNSWPLLGGPAQITLNNTGFLIQSNGLFSDYDEVETVICTIELTTARTTTLTH